MSAIARFAYPRGHARSRKPVSAASRERLKQICRDRYQKMVATAAGLRPITLPLRITTSRVARSRIASMGSRAFTTRSALQLTEQQQEPIMDQAVAPAPAANQVHYERRRPEETTLYQVVQEQLGAWDSSLQHRTATTPTPTASVK